MNNVNIEAHPELVAILDKDEDLNKFVNVSPEENLLRWFNYHLKRAGHPREVKNFSSDISDGENYLVLLSQIAPNIVPRDIHREPSPQRRAQLVCENADKMGALKFVTPEDINKGNDKLNLAFTAYLFNKYPGLDAFDSEDAQKKLKEAEDALREKYLKEEELRKKRWEEEEAERHRKWEEEERLRREQLEREEEDRKRKWAEEEKRLKDQMEEEERRRKERLQREAEEQRRKVEEQEEAIRRREEELRREAQLAEQRRREEEERRRQFEEEQRRRMSQMAEEEERRRIEEEMRKEEERRMMWEEEMSRQEEERRLHEWEQEQERQRAWAEYNARQEQLKREQEENRQRAWLEYQRQQELERQRQLELERQRQLELERLRQMELERQRQMELERRRLMELERQKQLMIIEQQRQQQFLIQQQMMQQQQISRTTVHTVKGTFPINRLSVTIVRGRRIKKSNVYCTLLHRGERFKTSTHKNTSKPEWNSSFELRHVLDTDEVIISVFDKDLILKDTFLGEIRLDKEDFLLKGERWYSLQSRAYKVDSVSGDILLNIAILD